MFIALLITHALAFGLGRSSMRNAVRRAADRVSGKR
jgi:hypothetical protein